MAAKTAALLIIGNEILSGRTQDANLTYLAGRLTEKGIVLAEARVVRDHEAAIVEAVNHLRATYDYVFTSGGIGPTHDDITMDCIARAFDVALVENADAVAAMIAHYGDAAELTQVRRRMTRAPLGATLIDNPVSGAPGVKMENVYVMAGVPKIMQAMVDQILPTLADGPQILSETVIVGTGESKIAQAMEDLQKQFPDVEIGSYPQYREGRHSVAVVARGSDGKQLTRVKTELEKLAARFT